MKRFFAFGCSFTGGCEYTTWADHLSNHFDFYENWGLAGLGNRGIFNRLNEAILKRKITKEDTVVIIWSTSIREDRILTSGHSWAAYGSIYNQPIYSREWVAKYFNPFMAMMETVNYVHAAQHILENIGCNWTMGWIINPTPNNATPHWGESMEVKDFSKLCDPDGKLIGPINKINRHPKMITEDMENFRKYCNANFGTKQMPALNPDQTMYYDTHPDPLTHYYFAKDVLAPRLQLTNFDQDDKIKELATEWHDYMAVLPRANPPAKINLKEYPTPRYPQDTF